MSPELDTLDQLAGCDMSLQVVRQIFPDDEGFVRGVLALLRAGDVRLLSGAEEVPEWQWRELFEAGSDFGALAGFDLAITEQGARRV